MTTTRAGPRALHAYLLVEDGTGIVEKRGCSR